MRAERVVSMRIWKGLDGDPLKGRQAVVPALPAEVLRYMTLEQQLRELEEEAALVRRELNDLRADLLARAAREGPPKRRAQ